MNNASAVGFTRKREDVEKLKKRWKKVKDASDMISKVAGTGFVASLLSPFDFEGPLIELITAALVGAAKIFSSIAEKKIQKYNTGGANSVSM